jgi:hypothetical protein
MEHQMNADKAIIVDDLLIEVGDRLFWDDMRPIRARRTPTGLERKPWPRKSTKPRPVYLSNAIRNTVRRTPEVMVKISGGGKSFQHVKNHLDYISRNGDVTLEDQNGNIFSGRAEVRDLKAEWRFGGYPISDEVGSKAAFNIVLSMPPGTDRLAVTDAARDFAKAEFGDNYSYVFATHDDEKHPHVHLCVKAMGKDGIRLNPRKTDLQRWREIFAEKLNDHGIEANATKRQVRGITRKAKKQPVVHIEQRNGKSFHRKQLERAASEFIKNGSPITNPLNPKIYRTRQLVVARWSAIGHALQAQGNLKSSVAVQEFISALPDPLGIGEQLEKQLRIQLDKQQQKANNKQKGTER